MRAKFVEPPQTQKSSQRILAPESHNVMEEAVVHAINSFDAGVSPSTSGHQADLYKQLIEEKSDKPAVSLFICLANLLTSGRAPRELKPFIRSAKGTALKKKAKDWSDDARTACSGETIGWIIGRAKSCWVQIWNP